MTYNLIFSFLLFKFIFRILSYFFVKKVKVNNEIFYCEKRLFSFLINRFSRLGDKGWKVNNK